MELSLRGVELHCRGHGLWKFLTLLVEDHRYMEGVTGTPYAPFSVNVSLHAVLDFPSSGVEPAQGLLITVSHPQVSRFFSASCNNGEGLARQGDLLKAFGIRTAPSDQSQLV